MRFFFKPVFIRINKSLIFRITKKKKNGLGVNKKKFGFNRIKKKSITIRIKYEHAAEIPGFKIQNLNGQKFDLFILIRID